MATGYSTGVSPFDLDENNHNDSIHHRHQNHHSQSHDSLGERDDTEIEDIIQKTSKLNINTSTSTKIKNFFFQSSNRHDSSNSPPLREVFIKTINPLILTAISSFVRLYRIDVANSVVWDEAHFGKFGSQYLKRQFYFDVHPPLGKLLIGLSGYLADYDGNFDFESSNVYPDNVNYVFMRIFNCFFGILVTPLAYKTAVILGYNQFTCWLIAFMVIFEQLSLTLSKFILLDSMLLFFTVLTMYCLVKVHTLAIARVGSNSKTPLTKLEIKWYILTGISIGCVCSVKWVGLFVTALVGFYTIVDLWIKFYQTFAIDKKSPKKMSVVNYLIHWVVRIFTLIIIPMTIYVATFKVHFMVLNHTGPDDGTLSTLLQGSLIGNDLQSGPRSVAFGSLVTIRSQGLSPNLIHSHPHNYPQGSQEQQVTTYGFKDDNNEFLFEFGVDAGLRNQHATLENENSTRNGGNDDDYYHVIIHDGDTVRINHKNTGSYLRANAVGAPITSSSYEVSCFGDVESNDWADEWVIKIQSQDQSPDPMFQDEDPLEIHSVSTSFRLKHKQLGCYLATTGKSYPAWGYQQGEVVCKYSVFSRDKNTWWNIEKHVNDKLPLPATEYVPPKPKFWKEFILLNYAMMASNNALIPDPDRFDKLSSEWWEWPILNTGLRMNSWGDADIKYFLLGNPLITWISTIALIVCPLYLLVVGIKYQRQWILLSATDTSNANLANSQSLSLLAARALLPLAGWVLHYVPFILMGRVKYLHHYVPALYFAIFVAGFIVDAILNLDFSYHNNKFQYIFKVVIYSTLYLVICISFWYFKDLSFGMEGSSVDYRHLRLLGSWMI